MGTTNQLFLMMPKIKADLIVDLDKSQFHSTLPVLTKHTDREKKLFRFKSVTVKKLELNGMLIHSDIEDKSGLI
jgi:hypothetical protein